MQPSDTLMEFNRMMTMPQQMKEIYSIFQVGIGD